MGDRNSSLDTVIRYQDAWVARDFDAARALAAEDIGFRSPQREIAGADAFFAMLQGFAPRIAPRWHLVSATDAGDHVVILYHLFSHDGEALFCADNFTLRNGRIAGETLVFDEATFGALASRTPAAAATT